MILAQEVRVGGAAPVFSFLPVFRFPFLLVDNRRENRLLKQNSHFVGGWATQKQNGGMDYYYSHNTPPATLRKPQGYTEEKPGTTTKQLPA